MKISQGMQLSKNYLLFHAKSPFPFFYPEMWVGPAKYPHPDIKGFSYKMILNLPWCSKLPPPTPPFSVRKISKVGGDLT